MSDPVDLERLRSVSSSSGTLADLELAESAVGAVLAAPTVWWCDVVGDVMPRSAKDHCDSEHLSGCGWVALVPVVGGQDAS